VRGLGYGGGRPAVPSRCGQTVPVLPLVLDRGLHLSHELGSHLADPVLLRVLHGVLHDLLLVFATDDVRAAGRRINLRAFDDFRHDRYSFSDTLGSAAMTG